MSKNFTLDLTGKISYRRVLLASAIFLLCAATGKSQRYLGIATSEWSAINRLYLNPAYIADCREKISIGILSLNVAVDNNLGYIPKIPDVSNAINNDNNIFTKSSGKKFSMLVPAAAFRGPGIMVSLGNNVSIALTSGIRGINQFNNFDPTLYKRLSAGVIAPTDSYTVKAQKFNWTAHMWSEVGFTISALAREGYKYKLNLGITIRRLGGIGYVSILGKNLDLDFREQSDAFYAANSDVQFASNVANDTSTNFKDITPIGLFKKFFGETAGGGMAADIGFTYRYRIGEAEPSDYMESVQTHDLTFSAAVTDFGSISYFNSTNMMVHITGQGSLSGRALDTSAKNIASMTQYALKQGFKVDTVTTSRKVNLPTALVLSADAQLYHRFYTNLLFIANLADRMKIGNSYYNQLTLTPRYDYHKMTIALPITYSMLAHDLKMGLGLRYTGLFLGSDDVLALMNKHQYGFGLYFGGYIPVFKIRNDPAHLHWGT
jgi:hypothetical protein